MGSEVKRTKVAIYVRVSTIEQSREGYSLDAQLGRLRDYCRAREWEISKEYVEDGYTGRDIKRPAYQEMMAREMSGILSSSQKWTVLAGISGTLQR